MVAMISAGFADNQIPKYFDITLDGTVNTHVAVRFNGAYKAGVTPDDCFGFGVAHRGDRSLGFFATEHEVPPSSVWQFYVVRGGFIIR
jgi:hypothetical protein